MSILTATPTSADDLVVGQRIRLPSGRLYTLTDVTVTSWRVIVVGTNRFGNPIPLEFPLGSPVTVVA